MFQKCFSAKFLVCFFVSVFCLLMPVASMGEGEKVKRIKTVGDITGGEPTKEELERESKRTIKGTAMQLFDSQLMKIDKLVENDEEMHKALAGSLALNDKNIILYKTKLDKFDKESLKTVNKIFDQGLDSCKRYENAKKPSLQSEISILNTSNVILVAYKLPSISVSKKENRGNLLVNFWICPTRKIAVNCFWLRRGGNPSLLKKGEKPVIDGSFLELKDKDKVGEQAYQYYAQMMYSVPLSKKHPNAGKDRILFLRDNIIVEVSTFSSFRSNDTEEWKTSGMSENDRSECLALLQSLDKSLIEKNDEGVK